MVRVLPCVRTNPPEIPGKGARLMTLEASTLEPAVSPSEAVPRGSFRDYVNLFIISFLVLFFELACIRWFGSMVVFLTFFTNIILMGCFLGMSVGCLAASRPLDLIKTVIPLTLAAATLACATLWAYNHFGTIMVDVGGQNSPQQI